MSHKILIVDDEADIRELLAGTLEDEGYTTLKATNSNEALSAVALHQPSLVLLDIWLQGSELDGIEILEEMQKDFSRIPVVMMSGHGNIETAVTAINLGAYDFIEKPFNSDRLLVISARALEASRLRRENEELRERAGTENQLIGRSVAINQLRQSISKVAPTNSRVLISGPAGSGKEVAARLMHKLSEREAEPFVVLNCASMDPESVGTELFGIEGTVENPLTRKIGKLEAAHKGILLFDEVGDMPYETQGKIVRVLQEQIFERIGGSTKIEVDVRVVATTSRDLGEEMTNGNFREDLFYRLSVVPIILPPLSARVEDISQLAEHFIQQAASSLRRPARALAGDAIAALQAYPWPGNVRELRNVIERLLIMAPGEDNEPLGAAMLPSEISFYNSELSDGKIDNINGIMGLSLRKARELFEKEYLHSQINRFGGNISRTASFIGMERSALHRKLKSLDINFKDKTL
jgi:two-component system, NtrC family, nitrogen regulation response regulator NtrX